MTIVAISTPLGAGGIGIIRLSGVEALKIASELFCSNEVVNGAYTAKYMYFGTVSADGYRDKGYMVYFKAPNSFTGEDVVELQLHGGVKLLEGVVEAAVKMGARPADKGEFTKRAFLNGKLALSDAEGVIDMINADSEAGLNAAYRLMSGDLSKKIYAVQEKLFETITNLEAVLDYPEELEDETLPEEKIRLKEIAESLLPLINSESYGKMAKYGIKVVLAGATNVGKSSLINKLLSEDRAIVTDIAGTTRDLLNESLIYKGVKINLTDTAGIRLSGNEIEMEGIRRAKEAIKGADVVLYVKDISEKYDNTEIEELTGKRVIEVYNKSDLQKDVKFGKVNGQTFYISAKTGEGVEELLDEIAGLYLKGQASSSEMLTSERHLYAVKTAYGFISSAIANYGEVPTDCLLVDLKEAWRALGEITGSTASEDIISSIFSRFCVGK